MREAYSITKQHSDKRKNRDIRRHDNLYFLSNF